MSISFDRKHFGHDGSLSLGGVFGSPGSALRTIGSWSPKPGRSAAPRRASTPTVRCGASAARRRGATSRPRRCSSWPERCSVQKVLIRWVRGTDQPLDASSVDLPRDPPVACDACIAAHVGPTPLGARWQGGAPRV